MSVAARTMFTPTSEDVLSVIIFNFPAKKNTSHGVFGQMRNYDPLEKFSGESLCRESHQYAIGLQKMMEARVGIEPTHKGFADLSLTTWVPRLGGLHTLFSPADCIGSVTQAGIIWSGRPGSNRRHLPWQGSTLPLSYSRSHNLSITISCNTVKRPQSLQLAEF